LTYQTFNFRSPDYISVFNGRLKAIARIRQEPQCLPTLKTYYKDHIADFICDFGITLNPKAVGEGNSSYMPFILYPRQREWVDEVVAHWRAQKPLLTEKTRQMGFSWLAMATACSLCLFHEGMTIGFGSRKESYVDLLGDPKSLLYKGREFLKNLPLEFRAGWSLGTSAPHMRLLFPETGSSIVGEAGDNIGRGATTSIYFLDEAAFIERPHLVEASLSQTTNCRVDISTPNGMGNVFAQKRHGGKIDVFTFHWRDDPTKDEVWYQKQVDELDPVTVAQEINIDYSASVEGVMIPSDWVQAAIDAHLKLNIRPTGSRTGALDVADEGKDLNAFCGAHGVLIEAVEEWSGKGSDIFGTVEKAFMLCDELDYDGFSYDADGLGAGVKGDARIVNDRRTKKLTVEPFRGSSGVFKPESEDVKGRKNEDFFANLKAQSWWALRTRFQKTFRAVKEGAHCDLDEIISIPSGLKHRAKLCMELSQPTYRINTAGKVLVDKAPDGSRSPNLADAVMIRFGQVHRPMVISEAFMRRIGVMPQGLGR
jgi:phage terminase large subunit